MPGPQVQSAAWSGFAARWWADLRRRHRSCGRHTGPAVSNGRNTPIEPHARYARRRPSAENAGARSNEGRARPRDRARLSTLHGDQIETCGHACREPRIAAGNDVASVRRPGNLRAESRLATPCHRPGSHSALNQDPRALTQGECEPNCQICEGTQCAGRQVTSWGRSRLRDPSSAAERLSTPPA